MNSEFPVSPGMRMLFQKRYPPDGIRGVYFQEDFSTAVREIPYIFGDDDMIRRSLPENDKFIDSSAKTLSPTRETIVSIIPAFSQSVIFWAGAFEFMDESVVQAGQDRIYTAHFQHGIMKGIQEIGLGVAEAISNKNISQDVLKEYSLPKLLGIVFGESIDRGQIDEEVMKNHPAMKALRAKLPELGNDEYDDPNSIIVDVKPVLNELSKKLQSKS